MSNLLTDYHFNAFGRITYGYAHIETGIKIAMAGILQVSLHDILVLTAPYSARNLKDAAKAASKDHLKQPHQDTMIQIIGDWSAISRIRNHIAHNRWAEGTRTGAIKPMYYSISDGKTRTFGDDDTESDYTPDDLHMVMKTLEDTNQRLKNFLKETGLAESIERKMADDSSAILESRGLEHPQSSSST